ncbi:hypothetical protein CEP52_003667 [Fusarium oligoseptatum]|uniref:Uncharacterized protein n=1 Tax=Fusarium oligoseptatum TaxID=2604345 RepID=A0A428U7J0_9HYPO|nr:hypothetical protein CEP52_003667 [Fusarium oligoseptatum]
MISSNTRASRSRYSSPAQSQNTKWNGVLDASKGATEGSRAFMQRWLEPTVQSKASFEDDGLMRYGVVENMAPLGSLPKPKKAAPETTSGVRRIILRPSGANAAKSTAEAIPSDPAAEVDVDADNDADAAAAAAAAAARARAEASSPPPTTQPPTPPRRRSIVLRDAAAAADDEDDEDYDPNRTKRRQSGRASLGRRTRRSSGGRRSSIVVTKPAAKETREPKEKEAKEVKETPKDKDIMDTIQASEPTAEPQDKEFIDKVVEAAVDEALKHYRYPTAWALRTLYDEKSGDPRFVAMIEDVFNQTADEDTMRNFSKQMEEKKREGKKDNQGCYYFIPPTTNSRFTPHKPKAAPYGKLLHHRQEEHQHQNHHADGDDEDEEDHHHRRAAKKAKTLHSSRSHSRSHSHSYSHSAPHSSSHPASGHATRHTPRKNVDRQATPNTDVAEERPSRLCV